MLGTQGPMERAPTTVKVEEIINTPPTSPVRRKSNACKGTGGKNEKVAFAKPLNCKGEEQGRGAKKKGL